MLLFLIPTICYEDKIRRLRFCYIENLREEYVQQITTSREILLTEWNEFCTSVSRCGKYDIDLSVGIRVDSVMESVWNEDGIYVLIYKQEIMEELYQTGIYRLENGAHIMLRIST